MTTTTDDKSMMSELNQECSEDEKSFLTLCELESLMVDKFVIKHNLNKWNLTISNCKLKANNTIQIDIVVPYTEMNLDAEHRPNDPEFFSKNTCRLTISNRVAPATGIMTYISGKTVSVVVGADVQYLLFDTPYFYPHNWYYMTNKEYLYKKISYSVNFFHYFMQAYKDTFNGGVPLMYIKAGRESKTEYEIDIILKEYLTISYVKTDNNTSTLFFHLLVEAAKKSNSEKNHVAKYHQITIKIPRPTRTTNVHFKFTANVL